MVNNRYMKYPRIKELREKNELTQEDVANILYISQRTYSHYEVGDRDIPIELIRSLAHHYSTSIDYLVGDTDIVERYAREKKTV